MLYFGGLTFNEKNPQEYLRIPNKVASLRIANTILNRYELRDSVESVINILENHGNIRPVLNIYRELMVKGDVGYNDFEKPEEAHRDSFYFSLLQGRLYRQHVEYPVKLSNKTGRIDLAIELSKYLIVT